MAKYLNSKAGGGGLAGRKVVVDFYDSKLNPNDTTNAEIQACENDVAMVGTVVGVRWRRSTTCATARTRPVRRRACPTSRS